MKPSTERFIDEVIEAVEKDYGYEFADSRNIDGKEEYLFQPVGDVNNLVLSFDVTSGMVTIDIHTSDITSDQKMIIMEDSLDEDKVEQAAASIDEMVDSVVNYVPEEELEDFNDTLDFESIYNTEEPSEEFEESIILCKPYRETNGEIMFVFNESKDNELTCMSCECEKCSCDPYYCDECEECDEKDKDVSELTKRFESILPEHTKVKIVGKGKLLPIQESYHKIIKTRD